MQKHTILLVDNKESTLDSLSNSLILRGYEVLTAKSEQEALEHCRNEVIHLAVIDIRLVDDEDTEDFSGLVLAGKMDPAIHIIILTARQFEKPEALVDRVLGTDHLGHRLASDFVWARDDPEKVYEKIRVAFETQIQANMELAISLDEGLTWRMLIEQIKMFRGADDAAKHKAEAVLEDLTRRLFHQAKALHLSPMIPGQGPCTVVKARPKQKSPSVIKFGPRQNIEQEAKNYEDHVEDQLDFVTTNLRSAVSRDMGGIVYKYVGGSVERVISFHDYYKDAGTTVSDLCKTLDNLFKKNCGIWYAESPSTEGFEEQRLDKWYRGQLNLVDQSQVERLKASVERLLSEGLLGQGVVSRSNGGIHLSLIECASEVLPDPIAFALEQNSSYAGSDFFPFPWKLAVTHGDLHGNNVLVDDAGNTWLIDFYKTGLGPALRDFAELESDIKFDLLGTDNLCERYELEKVLLAPAELNEDLKPGPTPSPQQARAAAAIRHLREVARFLTGNTDTREYYMALLFYALKRILGFTSSVDNAEGSTAPQIHALISAAMICRRLSSRAGKEGPVFLAHAYREP